MECLQQLQYAFRHPGGCCRLGIRCISEVMSRHSRRCNTVKVLALVVVVVVVILMTVTLQWKHSTPNANPNQIPNPPNKCPLWISEQSITPLNNTKHLLVSAYMDQRVKGFHLRIISVFKIDSNQDLYCVLCCTGQSSTLTPAKIVKHPEYFGFPFVTTDVMCKIPESCSATHVSLQTDNVMVFNQTWLPIRNQKTKGSEEKKLQFNFTVCVSTLFGGYNNVLQFAQSLEMYRLLGVDRVVIYNSSCGPDLDRLLQSYQQEGFVEIVPWPIDRHLNPSRGWNHSVSGGDLHYHGQMTTLNECIYRSMDSRYVLLNDIDEIIMPYKHDSLKPLMDMLQQQHPDTGVFLIENIVFPTTQFDPEGRFHLPQWKGVPGVNILRHIYREKPDEKKSHLCKMIIQPRMVEQTSVHDVLKYSGGKYRVEPDDCRLIHVRKPHQEGLTREQLIKDTRLWDFSKKLIPNVDKGLRRAGLLSSERKSSLRGWKYVFSVCVIIIFVTACIFYFTMKRCKRREVNRRPLRM